MLEEYYNRTTAGRVPDELKKERVKRYIDDYRNGRREREELTVEELFGE
ncbi:hypothetical protein V7182_17730 [Neobacillus drentensis]